MGNGGQRGGWGEWEGDNFEQEKRCEKDIFLNKSSDTP